MLATQRMGSYHGQDPTGLPFGCKDYSFMLLKRCHNAVAHSSVSADNATIEGMAFPLDYRPRGPPPAPQGKPLLNLSDQEQLDGFFAGFDSNNLTSNNLSTSGSGMQQEDAITNNEQPLTPQYFISSHTHMQGQPPFVDPNALEGGGSIFNSSSQLGSNLPMGPNGLPYNQMAQHTTNALPFPSFQNPHHSHDFFDQLTNSMSNTYPVAWPQTLPSSNINPSGPRPLVRFGSDSHFGPSGYVPPLGSAELGEQNGMQRFEWLEGDAQSTAPNTQPNTEPSSPVWTRKRKAEVDLSAGADHTNGLIRHAELVEEKGMDVEADKTPARKRRKSTLKPESDISLTTPRPQPSSVISTKPSIRGKRKSLPSTSSPAQPFSTTKATPCPSAAKPKRPPAITSASGSGSVAGGSGGVRVPLTSDQKRANHTNSEQRRRDQAQRAFARLFDLVPELEQDGKLSQMKKLERVVRKIRELEEGNQECRRRIAVVEKGAG
jgi:Helix-loop-helix DNA-binding domain